MYEGGVCSHSSFEFRRTTERCSVSCRSIAAGLVVCVCVCVCGYVCSFLRVFVSGGFFLERARLQCVECVYAPAPANLYVSAHTHALARTCAFVSTGCVGASLSLRLLTFAVWLCFRIQCPYPCGDNTNLFCPNRGPVQSGAHVHGEIGAGLGTQDGWDVRVFGEIDPSGKVDLPTFKVRFVCAPFMRVDMFTWRCVLPVCKYTRTYTWPALLSRHNVCADAHLHSV